MRSITCCVVSIAVCCCCQKAADKAPPLTAMPNAALKSAMWSMVANTSALSELLGKAAAPSAAEIAEARRLVDEVKKTVSALAADPASQQHPILGAGLPKFLAEVEAARAELAREPPQVEAARRLAVSCRGCHGVATLSAADHQRLAAR